MAEGMETLQMADTDPGGRRKGRPDSEWTMAAASHGVILITVALGPAAGFGLLIGPAVVLAVFLAYRSRSEFVARHALHALAYQIAGVVGLGLLGAVGLAGVSGAWGLSALLSNGGEGGGSVLASAIPITLIVAGVQVSAILSWMAYGLYAALQVYQGRDYRYWIIGEWVEHRLGLGTRP